MFGFCCLQKTGRLFMINPDNDPEKDIDMVQHLLGEFGLPEK
jgi:hypothetical protein